MDRMTSRMPLAAGLAAVALLAWSAPALALRPTVVDGGDFFKTATIDKANATIRQVKQQYGKDLMVETYRDVPADMREEFQKKGREGFYADWLSRRARALGVNGVFILITKNPGRLQVGVGADAMNLFTRRDRDELREAMLAQIRDNKFDDALLFATEFVKDRMERNAGAVIAANGGGRGAVDAGTRGAASGVAGASDPVRSLPTERPAPGNPPATAPVTLELPATIPTPPAATQPSGPRSPAGDYDSPGDF